MVNSRLKIGLSRREWESETRSAGTIVAVHGLSGTADDYHRLAPRLAQSHRVIAPDLPGFGRSPWDPEERYAFTDLVEALAEFIRSLAIEKPVVYLGHSIAGRMGILLADRHPDMVERLILVDSGPGAGPGSPKVRERVRTWPESGDRQSLMERYRTLYGFEDDAQYERRMAEYLEDLGEGRARIRRDPQVKHHIFPLPMAEGGPDLWGAWRRLPLPTLIVRGGTSQMLTPELVTKMETERPATTAVELPDIGHNIPSQAPEPLAEAVLRFLAG